VSIGLLVNEAATNAMKHGFTGDESAEFTVTLNEEPESDRYELVLSNSGRPFPRDVDIENPDTLGLQLIQALVSQLGGTLELQREPRPVLTVRFAKREA
jgi:two-component sensor histidine kinase